MLDWYIGEHMVSNNNIDYGIKEPTCEYQNCKINHILTSENLCILELLFGSTPFYTILILGDFT